MQTSLCQAQVERKRNHLDAFFFFPGTFFQVPSLLSKWKVSCGEAFGRVGYYLWVENEKHLGFGFRHGL